MTMLMNATPNQTMTSREIAELTGSTHDNVLKTIRALIHKGVVLGNETPYTHPQNGQTYIEFALDYRNTMVIVSGYNVEIRARIIDRWQELEAKQASTFDITNPLHLLQAIEVQARLNIQLAAERDHAVATKAQIGSKREATAMANTATANRKLKAIEAELGRCVNHATILAVQKATGHEYAWRPLKAYCDSNGIDPVKVHCPRYTFVKSWPARAWLEVYGVDIVALFGGVEA